jgi:uncharacterized LabA/DUF88 family protein
METAVRRSHLLAVVWAVKTNVYVDGFNLYYGCFQNRKHPQDRYHKWLDLASFIQLALPRDHIHHINYFTAIVSGSPQDPLKPLRQQAYIRALRTIPTLTVHEGHFLTTRKTGRVVDANGRVTNHLQQIEVREEKGSDVNIATHLLVDAFDRDFELAVIVSNDSDLVGPIEVVRKRFGLQVGVLNPQSGFSSALFRTATFYKKSPRSELANCQFPDRLTDAGGTFAKPARW